MNEIVQEFKDRCTVTHTSYFDGQGYVTDSYFDHDKFAHLIVLECLKCVNVPAHLNGEAEHYFREAACLIKQHFGIEP
jgi:hypothetical protein